MRFNPETIELTPDDRRLIRQSRQPVPFTHDEILDLCIMTRDAFEEEVDGEFDHLDSLRDRQGDMASALRDPSFLRYETVALARMLHTLSGIAIGVAPTKMYLNTR
jgi:hypothetical protein